MPRNKEKDIPHQKCGYPEQYFLKCLAPYRSQVIEFQYIEIHWIHITNVNLLVVKQAPN